MPRRSHRFVAFLVFSLCACAALTGCGIVGGASATNTPTATATPTITPTPTYTPTITPTTTPTDTPTPIPTPTPPPPDAELSQGRTAVLHVAGGGASGASAVFLGRTYQMVPDDTGFWIPIGAGATVEPGDHDVVVTLTDADGAVLQTEHLLVQVDPTAFPTENIDIAVGGPNGLQPASEEQKELDIRAALFAVESPVKLWSGPFIVPVPGPITTEFGTARSYNNGPIGEHHSGTDIGADEGTPVVAAATGRVVFAGLLVERGLSVIIDHGLGVFTAYHHLSSYNVAEGQDVQQGEVIGAVGMTGLATGPHLHWELVVGGQNVDPEYWTYQGVAP